MPGAGGKEVGRISIRVVPDLDGFREKLKAELEGIKDVKVNVVADTKGFREKVSAETKNLGDAKVKIKADVDKSDFAKAMAETRAAAGAAGVKLNIEFKDGEAEAKLAATIAKLKAEAAAADIKLRVSAVGGGGGGGVGLFGGAAGGAGGAGKLAMLGDQTFLIAGAVVAFLAPGLAMLATALASLPALIAAVALPIGAVVLGMDGFKKALENVGLMTTDKKGKAKPGVELKKLQEDVSSEFERGLTPIFRELVGLLPLVREGFTGIARGMVADIQGLSDAFTKGDGPAQIKNIFGNVGEMLNQAAPGLHNFASGLLNLASTVSGHLPGLARFLDEWAEKFNNWTKRVSQDGTLDKAVSGLKPVLDAVMSFVGRMMDEGIKLMSDPAMSANIKTVLDGITNFIVTGLPKLNEVFKGIAELMHALGMDKSAPGLPGPNDPKPKEDPHAIMGKTPSGDPTINAGEALSQAHQWTGKNIADPIAEHLEGMWNSWVAAGKAAIEQVKSFFTGIFNDWGTLAQAAWNDVVSAAEGVFQMLPAKLQGILSTLWAQVGPSAKAAWDGVVGIIDTAWQMIVAAVQGKGDEVVRLAGEIPAKIESIIRGAVGILEAVGRDIMAGLQRGIEAGEHLVKEAVSKLAGLIPQWAKDMLGIKSPSTVMEDVGQNTVQGLTNGLDAGAQAAVDRARIIAQRVAEALSSGTAPSIGGYGAEMPGGIPAAGGGHPKGSKAGLQPAASNLWDVIAGQFPQIGEIGGVRADALPYHPSGRALDIMIPGERGLNDPTSPRGKALGDQIYQFLMANAEALGIDRSGTLWQVKDHFNHIHAQVLDHTSKFTKTGLGKGGGAGGDTAGMSNDIKQALADLDVERDKLQAQRDAIPHGKEHKGERDALGEQLRQIKMARDALVTERDELRASGIGDGKGGKGLGTGTDSMSEAAQMITKGLAQAIDLAKNFVMSGVQQFESDIGIGGKGAIPTIANLGLGWAQQELGNMINADFGMGGGKGKKAGGDTHIHVNSVDEALTAKQTVENRKALQWKDR